MKRLTTFWGLVSAYWLSERWREAWLLSAVYMAAQLIVLPGVLVALHRWAPPVYRRLRTTVTASRPVR